MPIFYHYDCPGCGLHFELRKRVVLRRRRCPECGYPIRIGEIDRQRDEHERRQDELERMREEAARRATKTYYLVVLIVGGVLLSVCVTCGCLGMIGNLAPDKTTPTSKPIEPLRQEQPPRVEARQKGPEPAGPKPKAKRQPNDPPRRKGVDPVKQIDPDD